MNSEILWVAFQEGAAILEKIEDDLWKDPKLFLIYHTFYLPQDPLSVTVA